MRRIIDATAFPDSCQDIVFMANIITRTPSLAKVIEVEVQVEVSRLPTLKLLA